MIRNEQDHPRGCGEHPAVDRATRPRIGSSPRMRGALDSVKADTRWWGSSPRMRGARVDETGRICRDGIIPADAGSTNSHNHRSATAEDHPRGCGEHRHSKRYFRSYPGSSPRMRGAHPEGPANRIRPRIIPADAGSTSSIQQMRDRQGDHPRGCGEHTDIFGCLRVQWGSSPRMRGAQTLREGDILTDRIIPADAGSTSLWS